MDILISSEHLDNAGLQRLKSVFERQLTDCSITFYLYTGNDEEYGKYLENADYLLTDFVPLTDSLMKKASKLKAVSISATGYAMIDCLAAKQHGIGIYNVNEYCTEEVSIHAVAMILALLRGLKAHNIHIDKSNEWNCAYVPDANVPSTQNAVIYGYGKIGQQTARTLKSLGMKIFIVSSHADKKELEETGYHLIDEDNVFEVADIICNHQSAGNLKTHYFNKMWFDKLQRKPIFINVGRGMSADEKDIVEALNEGKIRGAGIDVLETEDHKLCYNPFISRDNVILTPHSAFFSKRAMEQIEHDACMNIVHDIKKNECNTHNCVVKGRR